MHTSSKSRLWWLVAASAVAMLVAEHVGVWAVFDVPGLAGGFQQCFLHQKLQHWRAGAAATAGHDILLHLRRAETLPDC